ncbi:sensory box protein [Hydrogenophaga sp. RAC07]|uniref:GAF domain-containing protein n=1 Tax=Hydrogenophaga sp. RAC07 TaxID=1842537 RepID=UPI0008569AF0|nr:GAF domain-containing protein [Hydrogenophaga sp. RAC07]AOF86553.1 sensory box protein [Hydrogenophaga sp. RAC07]
MKWAVNGQLQMKSAESSGMTETRGPTGFQIGIQSLLLLLVGMSLLPGFFLVAQNYRQARADAEQNLKLELQSVSVLAHSGQENVVAGVRNILETVASGPSVRRTDIRNLCFEFLGNIASRSADFANLGFADVRGDIQCIARGAGQQLNIADRDYFQTASSTRSFTIGGYIVGKVLVIPAMGFSIPVYDYQDNFVGVAFASLNLQRVNSVLQGLMLREGIRVDLVDANGILLGSTGAGFGQVGADYPDSRIRAAIAQAVQGKEEVSTSEHDGHWVQVRAVGPQQSGAMYVVASANTLQVFGALNERLLGQLAFMSTLLVAGLFLAWRLGVALVVKPVLALQHSMDEASVSPHRLSTRFQHRTKELHGLAAGLQTMVGRLRHGQQEIARAQRIAGIGFYALDIQAGVYRMDGTLESMLSMAPGASGHNEAVFEALFAKADIEDLKRKRTLLSQSGGELRIELGFLRPDGEQRIVEVFELLSADVDIHRPDQSVISGAIQDITDRKRLQRMFALLGSVNQVAVFSKSRAALYSQLCEVAVGVGEFRMAWVACRDADGHGLAPLAVAGHDDGYVNEVMLHQQIPGASESLAATAFRTQKLSIIENFRLADEGAWWRTEALRRGYRSAAAVPLMLDQEVVAVVILMAGSAHYFQAAECRLVVDLAASLSNALAHQRAVLEREQVLAELTTTSQSLIRAQALVQLGNWTRYAADKTAIWSRGLYDLLGRDPAEGPPPLEDARRNVHPDDLEHYMATMNAALGGRTRTPRMRYRGQRGDGQWRWFEEVIDAPVVGEQGQVLHVSGTVQDVTEQMEAERTLQLQLSRTELLNQIARATEERHDLKSVFSVVCENLETHFSVDVSAVLKRGDGVDVLLVEHLGERGKHLAMAAGLREGTVFDATSNGLARCLRGELIHEPELGFKDQPLPRSLVAAGLNGLVLVPLQSSGEVFGLILVARTKARAFSSGECEFLRQLGEHVSLAANHARLIESLQKAYKELEEAQHAALHQERLRLLGQMASGIAHDINNAISPVSLYADSLLMREATISEDGRRQLETIQLAVRDVADTIARMREFYRPGSETTHRGFVQPGKLVLQALELTKARWRTQSQMSGVTIEVETDLVSPCPDILVMEAEVRDAVMNLILNAVDAMPSGGQLTVATRVVANGGLDRLEIEVRDTGVGMDEETSRRCIEPFFTTKGDQGSGLGLAMVFGCMKRHGGEVALDSRQGEGTRVRLLFNLSQPDRPLSRGSVGIASDAIRLQGRHILLIDDDQFLLQAVSTVLRETGHEVIAMANGEAGLAVFEEHLDKSPFDIVLTDLGMPGIDGRAVALRIKAMSPATPVIMITGWGRRMSEDGEIPDHVDTLLSKPPQRGELLEAIERLTSRS